MLVESLRLIFFKVDAMLIISRRYTPLIMIFMWSNIALAEANVSCAKEIGESAAHALVLQCLFVSPSTRPPCHSSNECALIIDEITRGCGFLSKVDAPQFCKSIGKSIGHKMDK